MEPKPMIVTNPGVTNERHQLRIANVGCGIGLRVERNGSMANGSMIASVRVAVADRRGIMRSVRLRIVGAEVVDIVF